jgi:membrane protease YdiL (CAAX protease family)
MPGFEEIGLVEGLARIVGPALLAFGLAWLVGLTSARRGFSPPGFAEPWRRAGGFLVLAGIFWLGLFSPLGMIGLETPEIDPTTLSTPALFLLQVLLVLSLVAWFLLGFAGRVPNLARSFARQIGLATDRPLEEIGIGLLGAVGGWMLAMGTAFLVLLGLVAMGFDGLVPDEPPQLVPVIAGMPWTVKVGIALTAGIVEEAFFRGFLQPRVGIALSTALFALAHLSYDAPFMLVGITVLSLVFAFLVRWRQGILAAIVAHAAFDAIQLFIVVPFALKLAPTPGSGEELLEQVTALLPLAWGVLC